MLGRRRSKLYSVNHQDHYWGQVKDDVILSINTWNLGSSTTVSTPTTAESTDEAKSTHKIIMDDSSSSSPSVIIVAASLGAVLFVALIILIAVIILRRKKRQGKGRECLSVVRIKPLLLFLVWKTLSWYDDLEPLPTRSPITVLLPLGESHWRCQNVIFQMLFSFDWLLGLWSRILLQYQSDVHLYAWNGNWFLLPYIKSSQLVNSRLFFSLSSQCSWKYWIETSF